MVLAQPVGRKRSFLAGLVLTVVTFGIYAVYWNYKAHNEVYRQFELARENRDEGMVWYVLGLVVTPFLLAYFYVMAANVAYVRERIGLPRHQTPARFVSLVGVAAATFVVGIVALEVAFAGVAEDATDEQVDAALASAIWAFFGFALAALVLLGIAYHGLQKDINELWDAYHARMAYLQAHPEPEPMDAAVPIPWASGPRGGAEGGARRYYADLGPQAAPEGLGERWGRLRAEHPDLAEAPGMDALVARAGTDEAARREAETRLHEMSSALLERRRVLERRDRLLVAMEDLEARAAQGTVPAESYDAERATLEREWEKLRAQLDLVDARLSRLA